jgi:cytoskeletal protein RodZ
VKAPDATTLRSVPTRWLLITSAVLAVVIVVAAAIWLWRLLGL